MSSATVLPGEPLQRRWRRLALGWALLCALLTLLLLGMLPSARLSSSVLALLPQQERSGIDPVWQQELMSRLDRQLVWLVSLPASEAEERVEGEKAEGEQAALWWYQALGKLPGLQAVQGPLPELEQEWGRYFHDYRYQQLSEAGRSRLAQGASGWSQWVLGQIYSPLAGVSPQEWQQDPLLLTRSAVQGGQSGPLRLQQGWLVSRDKAGRHWYLLRAELTGSAFDLQRSPALVAELARLSRELEDHFPGAQLLRRGTLYYSDHAAAVAKQDISTIGLGSLLGVMLLIWWVFRGLRPLLLCLLPLAVGMVCGLLAVLLCFGEIHLFTLVISASLIGISDDYSLHYLSERRLHDKEETPLATALRLRQPLLLALATTLLGYLLLWLAPFPGLQQMAVFSLAGLIGSFISVFAWFPLLVGDMPERPIPARRLLLGWLRLWQQSRWMRQGLPLLLLLLAAGGLWRLQVDDDIRRLQPLPADLQAEEQQLAGLTGQGSQLTGFMVVGASAQETLQRLESLSSVLWHLQREGVVAQYRSLSDTLPSVATQQQNYQALSRLQPEVLSRLRQAGLVGLQEAIPPFTPLLPESWLASPRSEGLRLFWLARPDGRVGVLLPVSGVQDKARLLAATAALDGVHWQDKRQEWSNLFARYRLLLGELLLLGIGLSAIVLIRKLGWSMAGRVLLANAIALLLAAAVLGWCAMPFTLFGLLALSLVFGIGIDYGLFFAHASQACAGSASVANSGGREPLLATLLSVLLANLTTQLAFGLLALSHTQAIAGFGLVLSVGVFASFLLAPLAMPYQGSAASQGRGDQL